MRVSVNIEDVDELTGRAKKLVLEATNGVDEIFLQRLMDAMKSDSIDLTSVAFLLSDLRVIYFADQSGPSFESVLNAANSWASHQRKLQNEDRDQV